MSITASMINLGCNDRLLFAVNVPEWSTQHELIINSSTSWIKYPSPKGWNWLKLPMNEDYRIVGLSTPNEFHNSENEIFGTIIRSHIITNAERYGVTYKKTDVYLVIEMFL